MSDALSCGGNVAGRMELRLAAAFLYCRKAASAASAILLQDVDMYNVVLLQLQLSDEIDPVQ